MSEPIDLDDPSLFPVDALPPVSLADEFGLPPMSVLDRRTGSWQDRKRRWLALGIQSELGRGGGLLMGTNVNTAVRAMHVGYSGGVSIFDPVLAETAYRWWSAPGQRVLDPFAGGSVRGVVASTLGRFYTGIDIRPEQVTANEAQAHLGSDIRPEWITGDARDLLSLVGSAEYDLLFTCPPYADLERYSDDPCDLSTLKYPAFVDAYRQIIRDAVVALRRDRFAAIVVSDVRAPDGTYRGLVHDTITAFRDAGAALYNEAVILDQVGTTALRAARPFRATRKLARTHQVLLIFVKGDPRRAADAAKGEAKAAGDE